MVDADWENEEEVIIVHYQGGRVFQVGSDESVLGLVLFTISLI